MAAFQWRFAKRRKHIEVDPMMCNHQPKSVSFYSMENNHGTCQTLGNQLMNHNPLKLAVLKGEMGAIEV